MAATSQKLSTDTSLDDQIEKMHQAIDSQLSLLNANRDTITTDQSCLQVLAGISCELDLLSHTLFNSGKTIKDNTFKEKVIVQINLYNNLSNLVNPKKDRKLPLPLLVPQSIRKRHDSKKNPLTPPQKLLNQKSETKTQPIHLKFFQPILQPSLHQLLHELLSAKDTPLDKWSKDTKGELSKQTIDTKKLFGFVSTFLAFNFGYFNPLTLDSIDANVMKEVMYLLAQLYLCLERNCRNTPHEIPVEFLQNHDFLEKWCKKAEEKLAIKPPDFRGILNLLFEFIHNRNGDAPFEPIDAILAKTVASTLADVFSKLNNYYTETSFTLHTGFISSQDQERFTTFSKSQNPFVDDEKLKVATSQVI